MEILSFIQEIVKLPFLLAFKVLLMPLNLIPSPLWEIYGRQGYSKENRPDLRAVHTHTKGKRRLMLGCAIIAYTRGVNIKVHTGSAKPTRGVYTEDYDDIV